MFRRTGVTLLLLFVALPAHSQKLPAHVVLVKGAEPSASDSITALPESGRFKDNVYRNAYFGVSWRLPAGWTKKYDGPPPSDGGTYVLAQIEPVEAPEGSGRGTILITAQDLFFSRVRADDAMETVRTMSASLPAYYTVERRPATVKIGDRNFARFDYTSEAAQLHWFVLATHVRCHALQFVFASQDTSMLEQLIARLEGMKLPEEADAPLCVRDYATAENVIRHVEPDLAGQHFNPIPVRVIINKLGRVKHVHVISAFHEQAATITAALLQWRFKPYIQNGKPVEV
jgi:hypothetical protein